MVKGLQQFTKLSEAADPTDYVGEIGPDPAALMIMFSRPGISLLAGSRSGK
jgi:hypothetical protein